MKLLKKTPLTFLSNRPFLYQLRGFDFFHISRLVNAVPLDAVRNRRCDVVRLVLAIDNLNIAIFPETKK